MVISRRPNLLLLMLPVLATTLCVESFCILTPAIRTPQHSFFPLIATSAKQPKGSVPEFTVEEEETYDGDDDEDEFTDLDPSAQIDEEEKTTTSLPEAMVVDATTPLETCSSASDAATNIATTLAKTATPKQRFGVQYAALEPGTVAKIQVGDVARARKAWKKRRRSDSPLLVPCSVLNVDLAPTVRWNLIYLLEKFGETVSANSGSSGGGGGNKNRGIRISLSELSKRHSTHLKASLQQHAASLGFVDARALVEGLFHKQVQDAYGVKLVVNDEEDMLWLETPLSRFRAQSRAGKAAILQFCEQPVLEADTLQHTGIVRLKRVDATTTTTDPNTEKKMKNLYQLKPLSAALRVSQDDVEHGTVRNGSLHAAVVFDYDVAGDAGVAPLLTLSLNPQRNQVRDRLLKSTSSGNNRYSSNALSSSSTAAAAARMAVVLKEPDAVHSFEDLRVGDGPLPGKVVRLVRGGALVDCGVGRPATDNDRGSIIPVYGLLRFKDAILNMDAAVEERKSDAAAQVDDDEEDDEYWNGIFSVEDLDSLDDDDQEASEEDSDTSIEITAAHDDLEKDDDGDNDDDLDGEVLAEFNLENDDEFEEGEDITHLFQLNEDGTLAYTDPETGETKIISDVVVHDDHDEDEDEDEEDGDEGDFDEDDEDDEDDQPVLLASLGSVKSKRSASKLLPPPTGPYKTQTLRAGDRIDVFVKSVSKQTIQLMLSMDSSIHGMKAKDLKKESEVSKKLSRLAKQLGGFKRIRELNGVECNGVVKATSNAGDWLYVQPDIRDLPVGVATVSDSFTEQLMQGDSVRIQLNGVDEDRGQLAIRILKKLST